MSKQLDKNQNSLYVEISQDYGKLIAKIASVPSYRRHLKEIDMTGGKISLVDLISYQIGWGNCLIRWYETGLCGKMPEMPGEGFSTWDYVGIACHFYQKYQYDGAEKQMAIFHKVVTRILEIIKQEDLEGNLDRLGVWPWCTLSSGKQWPLKKWVRVNTSSPYKRATSLIRKIL